MFGMLVLIRSTATILSTYWKAKYFLGTTKDPLNTTIGISCFQMTKLTEFSFFIYFSFLQIKI